MTKIISLLRHNCCFHKIINFVINKVINYILTPTLLRCRPTSPQTAPSSFNFFLFLHGTRTTLVKIELITITCTVITPEYSTLHGTPNVNRIPTCSLLHCDERIMRGNIPILRNY